MRAIAIMPAGMFLSQPPTTRTPSMHCPLTDVSIASAMTSRDTSEYFIPSVPMPMPSVTVGKPKTCGFAPAAASAAIARSTSGWIPALQGFIVLWPLATPTIGLSKSPSAKPTARSIARFGERATPCVMMRLRRLLGMASRGSDWGVDDTALQSLRECGADASAPWCGDRGASGLQYPGQYQRHADQMLPTGALVEEGDRE